MFYENPDCAYKITGVFYIERSKNEQVLSTMRRHTAIAYRITGESQFHFNGITQTASAGSVTYFPANTNFKRSSVPEKLIILHLHCFEETSHNIEIINHVNELEPLFQKLLSTWETKNIDSYNRSIQILYKIFGALQKSITKQSSPVPAIIKPGVELLQNRYKDSSLRISDLSNACFISEVYFRKIYHRYFGESPQKTLNTLRFNYVCELLCSGYYTQKEAAQLSGFPDVKYFRTAFKKSFGITPGDYIKKNINILGNPI